MSNEKNYYDSVTADSYRSKSDHEVIIEIAVMQRVMMQDIVSIKNKMSDLQERKLEKTEFNSFETKLISLDTDFDNRISKLEEYKWKIVGIAGGVGILVAIAGQIYDYLVK